MAKNVMWFTICVLGLVLITLLFQLESTSRANWDDKRVPYPGYTAIASMGSTTYYVNGDNDVIIHTYNWQGLDEMVVTD